MVRVNGPRAIFWLPVVALLGAGVAAGFLMRADAAPQPTATNAQAAKAQEDPPMCPPPKRSAEELKKKLTARQYEVTQEDGTEPPFQNEFWNEHRDGIYVDVVSGEPLFSSLDKYDSGTGWPSFTKPLEPDNVKTRTDHKLFMPRTEVRSKMGDSHLGHVFDDGPAPTGKRYCMNSASLRFVPVERLEAEGYGKYLALFQQRKETKAEAPARTGGAQP